MNKANLTKIAVAVSLFLLTILLLGWRQPVTPIVYSQALSCYEQGEKAVCFDADPIHASRCETLSDNVLYCTNENG